MINFDDVPKYSYIADYPYRALIIRKTNALLNLIIYQPDRDKIYLHAKDPYEIKYYFWLINTKK